MNANFKMATLMNSYNMSLKRVKVETRAQQKMYIACLLKQNQTTKTKSKVLVTDPEADT